jgi:general secretion pathway protein J
MTRPARPRGFTLIEVLIALFILALMAALAWRGVDVVLQSRDTARRHTEAMLRLQTALGQWEADVKQAVQTQQVPAFDFDGATLRLTRSRPAGIELVAWTLRNGTLVRWAAPPVVRATDLQDAWIASQQLQGNEAGTVAVLSGVAQQQLYTFYTSSKAWSNAQSSGDRGEGNTVSTLPDGVRWVLALSGPPFTGTLQRSVRIVHP